MSEIFLTTQRTVHDIIVRASGLEKFKVTKELMQFVREAYGKNAKDRQKRKQEQTVTEKKKQQNQKHSSDLKKTKYAIQKCEDELKKKDYDFMPVIIQ